MAPVVLYKYLNYNVNKTTNAGHIINYNTKYCTVMLMMILLISSWSKPLKTELNMLLKVSLF